MFFLEGRRLKKYIEILYTKFWRLEEGFEGFEGLKKYIKIL